MTRLEIGLIAVLALIGLYSTVSYVNQRFQRLEATVSAQHQAIIQLYTRMVPRGMGG